jgi:predicted RNase H-like HicB family nuclease
MRLMIMLKPGEDGWIGAECPQLPGCASQGRTREEAMENIRVAIDLCIAVRREQGWEKRS